MTREDIIRMAREVGGTAVDHAIVLTYEEAQRFAELVAAAERERCAKVCEETTIAWTEQAYNNGCTDCAQRIRSLT